MRRSKPKRAQRQNPGGRQITPRDLMALKFIAEAQPVTRAQDVSSKTVYAFRQNCSYRRHFEAWFKDDMATPGKIFEMESYHGMLACVTAGAGVAMVPRSMLESMPGSRNVNAYPLGEEFRYLNIWLTWRRGVRSPALSAFIDLVQTAVGRGEASEPDVQALLSRATV